jgi:hypothetical protein
MLRLLVLLLILANGAYYAWSQGYLRPYTGPAQQTEPQRIAQQLRPEAVKLLAADELKRIELAAAAPPPKAECLQAGLYDGNQAKALRTALEAALPGSGSWQLEDSVEPARWIVYMGKYPNEDALAKKKAELATLNLKYEVLSNPAMQPGLSLGAFSSQAEANAELARLTKRGVHTAKVVQERAEARGTLLRLPAVDEALRAKLDELKTPLAGKPLRACVKPANGNGNGAQATAAAASSVPATPPKTAL